jgi:hypothetical protein
MPGFFYEGNGFFDTSVVNNSTIGNANISNSTIVTSSINMLSSNGNYQIITNHNYPINPHDVAIKAYVDQLGIVINTFTLNSTIGSTISNQLSGSFVITVKNLVLNGPSAIFNVTKNESTNCGQSNRQVATPGVSSNITLFIDWPPNSGIILYKNGTLYDGSYLVKIM